MLTSAARAASDRAASKARTMHVQSQLNDETRRLHAARAQLEQVKAKVAEINDESTTPLSLQLKQQQQQQRLIESQQPSDSDDGLRAAFSAMLERLMAEIDVEAAELEEDEEDQGTRTDDSDSESVHSGLSGAELPLADKDLPLRARSAARRRDKADGSNIKSVRVMPPPQLSTGRASQIVRFRINETFMFADLQHNACRYWGIGEEAEAEMELYCPTTQQTWPRGVLVQIALAELHNNFSGTRGAPNVQLRDVPPIVQRETRIRREQLASGLFDSDRLHSAQRASQRAQVLARLVRERKKDQRSRLMVLRAVLHFFVMASLAVMLVLEHDGHGYETAQAVRQRLKSARFADFKFEVTTVEGLRAYLRGKLMDALAPQQSYAGRGVDYDATNCSGAVGTYNNMLAPLRLHQTRYESDAECVGVGPTYKRHIDGQYSGGRAPLCFSDSDDGKESFGAVSAFTYRDDLGGDPICSRHNCYGPAGFVQDVWAARDYRATVDGLLDAGWIDSFTRSVAVRLQLANPQTGCLVVADLTFKIEQSGEVTSGLRLHPACAGLGMGSQARESLWSGEVLPVSAMHPYFITTYVLLGLYSFRLLYIVCRLLYRLVFKPKRPKPKRGGKALSRQDSALTQMNIFDDEINSRFELLVTYINPGFVVDMVLLVTILSIFSYRILLSNVAADTSNFLLSSRRALLEQRGAGAAAERVEATLRSHGSEEASAGLRDLYASAGYGCLWEPTPELVAAVGEGVNVSLPFDVPGVAFADFTRVADIYHVLDGLHSVALFLLILRFFSYLRFWRPLVTRMGPYALAVPSLLAFVVLLVHFQIAFQMLGMVLFGFNIPAFEDFASSQYALLGLLTNTGPALNDLYSLAVDADQWAAILYLFAYTVSSPLTLGPNVRLPPLSSQPSCGR